MKNIRLEHKILIIVIVFLLLGIIANNLLSIYAEKSLVKEAKKIDEIISKQEIDFTGTILYTVENNQLSLNGEVIEDNIKGNGKVFYDDKGTVTIILERFEKCAIKILDNEEASILNSKCPNYELLQGATIKVEDDTDIYKYGNEFVYKGIEAENYIVYDNEYWRIVSFTNEGMKIVNDYAMGNIKYSDNDNNYLNSNLYNYLNNEYGQIVINNYKANWNIAASNGNTIEKIIQNEQKLNTKAKVGTLTLSDYYKSIDGKCEEAKDEITCVGKSYLQGNNDLWLSTPYNGNSTSAWYADSKSNLHIANVTETKDIKPVLVLDKHYKIINGDGTKENPYILTILSE